MRGLAGKLVLAFVAGVVGFFCGAGLVASRYDAVLAQANSASVVAVANDIYLVKHGRMDKLLELKEMALPGLVEQLDRIYRKHLSPGTFNRTMWVVARLYQDGKEIPPPAIAKVLNDLPPRPPTECEVNRGQGETDVRHQPAE